MLYMESPHQAIYAPLNQVITDSDEESEEEIHNSTKHRLNQLYRQQLEHQRFQQQRSQHYLQNGGASKRNPPTSLALRNFQDSCTTVSAYRNNCADISTLGKQSNNHQQCPQPSSYTTNMQNTFRSVMMSDIGLNDQGSNFSSFNSDYDERNQIDADNVAILGRGDSKDLSNHEPMTTVRRCVFIASLLLCLFTVVGFVWLVPCGQTCPAPVDQVKTHNWLNNCTKMELKGGVNVVNGLRSWENNLIFLYRGDAFFPESRNNDKRNGVISLIGSSGAVSWFVEMMDEPVAIDCTLIDVDHNGRSDCLVLDEFGELGAIDPISGEWHWHFKERSARKVDALDFPVILPDLDDDKVLEILIVTSASLEQRTRNHIHKGDLREGNGRVDERNFLRILSGRTGIPMGDGFKVQDCDALRKLQLENSQMVTFNCLRNNTEAPRSKTLAELFALITNKSIASGQKLLPASKISQHKHFGQRKDTDTQSKIYSLSGRELKVENRGKCPEDCNVTFVLVETRNNKTIELLNFTHTGTYGMVPAQWHFKNSKTEMSGFVMKFWNWSIPKHPHNNIPNKQNLYHISRNTTATKKSKLSAGKDSGGVGGSNKSAKQNHIPTNKTKRSLRQKREQLFHEFPTNSFSAFDHLIQKQHTYTLPLTHKNVTRLRRNSANMLLDNYQMQMITETVLLVLFIGADTHIENTSQSDIVQFCRSDHNEVTCQPDLNNQENSMLIADFDMDGSQELVSYSSTFVQNGDDTQNWTLVTYVRLLRLQSELHFLHEQQQRN